MSPSGLTETVIDGPPIALIIYAAALMTATLLVRWVPVIKRTMTTVETTRLTSIDGLRGLLGVGVLVHHTVITWFFLHSGIWQLPPSRIITHLGETSVSLFFMITAFLFWGRVVTRGVNMDWLEFLLGRLYRLYPAHLLMLGFLTAGVMYATRDPLAILHASFLRPFLDWLLFTMFAAPDLNSLPQTSMLVANVTWSLVCEWLFYAALPILAFMFSPARSIAAVMASVLVFLGLFWGLGWTIPYRIAALPMFLGGIASVYWVRSAALQRWSRGAFGSLAALLAIALVVSCFPTAYTPGEVVGLTIFFAVVASGNDFWGILRWPGLLWLGDVTYSIYLLHGLLLWLVFQQILPHALAIQPGAFILTAVAVAIVLVLACSATFLLVERPGVVMGKRHYRLVSRNGGAASRPNVVQARRALASPLIAAQEPPP